MKRYTTLTEFIDEQCTRLNLPKDEKTVMKMRNKFTRTLKDLGIWDQAETKIIDRARTKVFTNDQLYQLQQAVRSYMIKLLPTHEREEIEQTQQENIKRIKDHILEMQRKLSLSMEGYDLDEYDHYVDQQYEAPKPTQEEINNLMLEALFLKFFEPIDITRWSKDLALLNVVDAYDTESATDPVNIKAQ
ncbi:hypothetical protein GMC94_10705, partial [Streptococcus parasanguinis]